MNSSPNKRQWAAIWIGAALAFLALEIQPLLAVGIVIVFLLLVWQLSTDAAPHEPKVFCSECGQSMDPVAKFCSNCGTATLKHSGQT